MNKLVVRNVEQAAAWLELDGQLSDGFWENARPYDHWKIWCDAEVSVARPGEPVGRNFYPMKSNYNFSAKALLDVVGKRMLGVVRIARKLGLDTARKLEFAVDCETGRVDWTRDYNQKLALIVAAKLGGSTMEAMNQIELALKDESYTMTDLRRDLNDLKKIVQTGLPYQVSTTAVPR